MAPPSCCITFAAGAIKNVPLIRPPPSQWRDVFAESRTAARDNDYHGRKIMFCDCS
ncbi:hypothetical protein OKW32_000196 [Paraburkholderia youngii]